ncbi:hypothetical protein OUZ56_011938 [Daphnia magna]|uniref:Tc1-like transposase DDE domain-containing protein n=1 Tax=Daphnia magna TaxID=35525 RepID=A0ABQ9Z1K0_9CRUS|nr:hypothetical protein OUZ56_011938 [Daphnia magna]
MHEQYKITCGPSIGDDTSSDTSSEHQPANGSSNHPHGGFCGRSRTLNFTIQLFDRNPKNYARFKAKFRALYENEYNGSPALLLLVISALREFGLASPTLDLDLDQLRIERTLGVMWNGKTDMLTFKIRKQPSHDVLTKRNFLIKLLYGEKDHFQILDHPRNVLHSLSLPAAEPLGEVIRMVWPPQSPDLNPIEQIWDHVDSKIRKMCNTSKNSLWVDLQTAWDDISIKTF